MTLSVIIPCLNGAETIATQLEALAAQRWSGSWEIIVADNGSTDASLAVVGRYRERLPTLRVIDASDRCGQPHALNVGVRAAGGDALLFCDADDEVGPGWLAAMGQALARHDFVACRFDFNKLAVLPRKDQSHAQETGLNVYRYPPFLPHTGSGGMGVRRGLHEAVGGFDEDMPILFDTDYCFRVQLAGTALHFVPDAVVYVRPPDTLGRLYRKGLENGEYNVLLYKRWRPWGMPRLSWKTGVTAWIMVLRSLPQVRHPEGRTEWVWQFGCRLGRVLGSIKHRVLAL